MGVGGMTIPTSLGIPVFVTGAAWGTNAVQITGIASNVLTINNGARAGVQGIAFTLELTPNETAVQAPGSATRMNAFVTGSRNTSAGVGTVTLISPFRILTGLGINWPAVAVQTLVFVPEPGTLLLLVSSAIGLALVGRNRLRK